MDITADTIEDIGPQPQSFDIERATKKNINYRSVAWSGRYLQVTLMSIPVGGDIGLGAHPETDQFLRLDASSGRVQMGPAKDKLTFEKNVSNGCCVLVPAGTCVYRAATAPSGIARNFEQVPDRGLILGNGIKGYSPMPVVVSAKGDKCRGIDPSKYAP